MIRPVAIGLLLCLLLAGCDYDGRNPVTASVSGTLAQEDDAIALLRVSLTTEGQPFDEIGVRLGAVFNPNQVEGRLDGIVLDTAGNKLPNEQDEDETLLHFRFRSGVNMTPFLECVELSCRAEVLVAPPPELPRHADPIDWYVSSDFIVDHAGGRTDEAAITLAVEETTATDAGLPAGWTIPMPYRVIAAHQWDISNSSGPWQVDVEMRVADLEGLAMLVVGSAWGDGVNYEPLFLDESFNPLPTFRAHLSVAALQEDDFTCDRERCKATVFFELPDPPGGLHSASVAGNLIHPDGMSVPDGATVIVNVAE